MAVTLQQIAEAAGVSRGTVDRALNNRGRIRPEVEEKIKKIAQEMGYQPSRAGRALAMAKRKIRIGVILQYMKTPFMQQVLKGVLEAKEEVESFGGYIEYSSVGGSSYLSESSQRTAWYTVRIPEAKLETFISKVGDNGNITNISQNIRDITLEYVDVAGRISTLKAELERLNELLSEASSIEDILAIESKISDVRYELESYQSQMNSYDNQIDYSTVNINILEVDVVSASQSDSAWEQIQSGFMSSLYGLGRGLSSFVIGLLSAIPYLAVIAVVIVIIVKVAHRRGRKKKERQAEQPKTDETEQ